MSKEKLASRKLNKSDLPNWTEVSAQLNYLHQAKWQKICITLLDDRTNAIKKQCNPDSTIKITGFAEEDNGLRMCFRTYHQSA